MMAVPIMGNLRAISRNARENSVDKSQEVDMETYTLNPCQRVKVSICSHPRIVSIRGNNHSHA